MRSQLNPPVEKTIGTLLNGLVDEQKLSTVFADKTVSGLTLDSRLADADTLFAAVPGLTSDGRRFVEQAISKGAQGVLFEEENAPAECRALEGQDLATPVPELSRKISLIASRLFSHPSRKLKVVGITGTNGKTTCATLLQQALSSLDVPCAMMGTLGASFGEYETASTLTTADGITVQQQLHGFESAGAKAVCMEVSSHGLDQCRVSAVDFNVAVLTNLTQDHLDYHQSMQAYGEAKKKLFDFESLEAIVVNRDDALGREILSEKHSCKVLSYGLSEADVVPLDHQFSEQGIFFEVEWNGEKAKLQAPLFGNINLPNLLAVTATLLTLGFELKEIAEVFPKLSPPPGRMERFSGGQEMPTVVVDYSHTPDSLKRAIDGLKEFVTGRIWVVFGCGGDRDKGKRPQMGQVAEQGADVAIVTNDNPRSEDPEEIARNILCGMSPSDSSVRVVLDRKEAISYAIENAAPHDLVLVAGKGHEDYQVIGEQVLPFSDRQVVLDLLGGAR